MKVLRKIKTNIKRHFKRPPAHIGYVHFGDNIVPEYRCPAEDCEMGVTDDWVCCPYCGQKLGEFEENKAARFVTLRLEAKKALEGKPE